MSDRIALYARFSSDLQNPRSAQDQLAALRAEIARRFPTWVITVEERDEAVSGTSLAGREGLRRLLAMAAQVPRPFDAVVVEDLSRFARNRADSVRLREAFGEHGVRVLSAADGFVDPDSEAGLFLTGIREIKAEADSKETGRRVRRGVRARTLLGWVSGRRTPFGYRRVPVFSTTEFDRDGRPMRLGVRFEPDPATGPIVAYAFRRYAEGLGLRRLANELNNPAGPYRAAKPSGYITSFLRAMLLNSVYRGENVYARTIEKKVRVGDEVRRRKLRLPAAEHAVRTGAHEALVDEETWRRVQARFQARAGLARQASTAVAGRGRGPVSILSGLVRCGVCGGGFVVWTSGANAKQRARGIRKSQRRFVCGRHRSSGKDVCTNTTSIEVGKLERRVLDALEARVLTPEGIAYLEGRRREVLLEGLRSFSERAPGVEREWAQTLIAERRLVEALKAGIGVDAVREEAGRLSARRADLERERGQLAVLERLQTVAAERQVVENRLERLRDILTIEDLSEVREALRGIIVRVEIGGDGGSFVLVGDGPLEPLPGGEDLLRAMGEESSAAQASRSESRGAIDVPGAEPCGHRPESRLCVVGATGFEPATSWSRTKRATKLRYAPVMPRGGMVPGFTGEATAGGGAGGGAPQAPGRSGRKGTAARAPVCWPPALLRSAPGPPDPPTASWTT
jgi:site-specific DNA recombinase